MMTNNRISEPDFTSKKILFGGVGFCVSQTEYHPASNRLTHIGGMNSDGNKWQLSIERAIAGIECGEWYFYVEAKNGITELIITKDKTGTESLEPEFGTMPALSSVFY